MSDKGNLKKPKASKSKQIDPELDVRSDKFNPLKALMSTDTWIPIKSAPIYDNLAKYESVIKQKESGAKQQENTKEKKILTNAIAGSSTAKAESTSGAQLSKDELTTVVRRFLPHQAMVKGTGKKTRHTRNLLLRMENESGPLKWLRTCKIDQKRIKIYTRNESSVNGYVSGFVEAFDKHWNIALSDVLHVWKRKKLHYCATAIEPNKFCYTDEDNNNGDGSSGNNNESDPTTVDCVERLKLLGIEIPEIKVKSLNRKYVECTRHVSQLVIRGEQIAIITLAT